GPDSSSHCDGEQTDGTGSGDRYGFRRDLAGEHGVHSISQRIENRSVLLGNGWIQLPDVGFWDLYELCEGAVSIHADDFYELADVRVAGTALQALAACDVHLGGNEISLFDAGDFAAVCDHLAAKFVSRDERRTYAALGPTIPIVDMQIGTADGS